MLIAVGPADWAVFSGAGISGAGPARLPMGNRLRNDVLGVLFAAVEDVMPGKIPTELTAELTASNRKLEVVIGRLVQTIGEDALGCLFALRLHLPNESHLLAAVHLAHGGLHVTVNLDVGIEVAYDLLTKRRRLPAAEEATYASCLAAWQRLLPPCVPPLHLIVLKQEFDDWVAGGRPPGLLKLHGSLSLDQRGLLDPVVVDIDELAQLSTGRVAAVDRLGEAHRLLITGYAGEDIDCYAPLLKHVGSACDWRQVSGGERVRDVVHSRGGRFFDGRPEGLAVTGLLEVLGQATIPDWPEGPVGLQRYETRFRRWADELRQQHAVEDIASAAGWLLADIGHHDLAVNVLRRTATRKPTSAQRVRLATVLFERAGGNDRREAAQLFRRVATDRDTPRATRLHALLRVGDEARGRLIVGSPTALLLAVAAPTTVLAMTRGGRAEPEAAATAYRALQQLALRLGERAAALVPASGRAPLAALLQHAANLGIASIRLTSNGNAAGLARQHQLALLTLAAMLHHRSVPAGLLTQLEELRSAYLHGDDLPGVGNCLVTRALAYLADGHVEAARTCLAEARDCYIASRVGVPSPAGMAFADAADRLITVFGYRPAPASWLRYPSALTGSSSLRQHQPRLEALLAEHRRLRTSESRVRENSIHGSGSLPSRARMPA